MKSLRYLALLCMTPFLVACGAVDDDDKALKVGTISGPETVLMAVAKHVAAKNYHLAIKIVEFSDYTMPNVALSDESIDANVYQHQPYLDTAIKLHGYD